MSETLEIEEQMKILESWLDKTSELLLSEADRLTDLSDGIVKIIATKREEYARLGFKKESIQTQINRLFGQFIFSAKNLKAFQGRSRSPLLKLRAWNSPGEAQHGDADVTSHGGAGKVQQM